MRNVFSVKALIIFIFISSFPLSNFADQKQRYLWLNVVYVFTEPERFIEEKEVCEYVSSKSWDSQSLNNSQKRECTYTPARYIPKKSTSKVLSVHVDCQDKTYDAKGDGKGWRKIQLQSNVMRAAIQPCMRAGYQMDYLTGFTIKENKKVFNSKSRSLFSYKECLQDSLNLFESEKPEAIKNPKLIGLSSDVQVNAYYLYLKSKLPKVCKKINNPSRQGLSKLEIELIILNPLKLEAMEYVIQRIPSCK
mgnify:CR=1 FL=1|tara:strand:+ start:14143 stop:14889 length:747 start_codon:yes stop_codon:yes gene_type:complete